MDIPSDLDKVVLAGDWHGNLAWAQHAVEHAAILGVTTILQLGDFGLWSEGYIRSDEYIWQLTETLRYYDSYVFWIDGNHEDHPRLLSYPVDPDTGLRPITDRIIHIPRGHRWVWGGLNWLALGGAYSIDRNMRKEGVSWWPEEEITDADVSRAIEGGPADVIVCHDAPDLVDIPGIGGLSDRGWPDVALRGSQRHRELLGRVVDATGARRVFHGHMHRKYTSIRQSQRSSLRTVVTGLDCDGTSMGRNLLTLNLSS